jgi:hypothetical protein
MWLCWVKKTKKTEQNAEEIIQHLYKKTRICKLSLEGQLSEFREHEREAVRFKKENLGRIAESHIRIALHAKQQAERQQAKYENLLGLVKQLVAAKDHVQDAYDLQASALTLEELLAKSNMPDIKSLMEQVREHCVVVQEHTNLLTEPLVKEEEEDADFYLPDAPNTATVSSVSNKNYQNLVL